ncbi:hypothetical protein EDB85DRAFT_2141860 [Lactarius pseudohatsudake]|nr:hypothetical protein EDB85DRAFT_2141860 [Lactarius pseudohatsudake]
MATTMVTEEALINEEVRHIRAEANAILLPINPSTRHRMDADEAAIFRTEEGALDQHDLEEDPETSEEDHHGEDYPEEEDHPEEDHLEEEEDYQEET